MKNKNVNNTIFSEVEDAFESCGYDNEVTKESFRKLTLNIKSI